MTSQKKVCTLKRDRLLDVLGKQRYPWYSTQQLADLHCKLNTGKTVTWFTKNKRQQLASITYPMREFHNEMEDVITISDTTLYPGKARELQIQKWKGPSNSQVCRFFKLEVQNERTAGSRRC